METISSFVTRVAKSGGEAAQKESVEMLVTSFALWLFRTDSTYRFSPEKYMIPANIVDVSLVMKDGSKIVIQPRMGSGTGGTGKRII